MTKPKKKPAPTTAFPVTEVPAGLSINDLLHIYKKTAPVQLPIQFP